MASDPVDPLQTLHAALTAPVNSKEQADILAVLRETLENHPKPIPILLQTLFNNVVNAADSLLKRWVLDLFHYAICRSGLTLDQKTQMALTALDTLAQLLDDPTTPTVKVTIQCMAAVYPLVFRHLCTNRVNSEPWTTLSSCKARITELVWAPNVNVGIRLSAMKFVQRVVLVQTRGVSDPRLQKQHDPNISFCPVDHPFISAATLEAECQRLLEALAALVFSSKDVDLLTALVNSWVNLVKQRPASLPFVVNTLRSWTPAALTGHSASSIKSVEKAVRILLVHISKLPISSQYSGQISEALSQQAIRMEKAVTEEKRRKAALSDSRKRPSSAVDSLDNKRIKLDCDASAPTNSAAFLSSFDFTSLPATLITNLIVSNLEAFTEAQLIELVNAYRQSRGIQPSAPSIALVPASGIASTSILSGPNAKTDISLVSSEVKEEAVDPLQMDIDEYEMEYEPEKLNEELAGAPEAEDDTMVVEARLETITLDLADFKLPPPKEPSEDDRLNVISTSLTRIWGGVDDLKVGFPLDPLQSTGISASELWMLLVVRMITRVAEPPPDFYGDGVDSNEVLQLDMYSRQDRLRQTLCDYIMADFSSRMRLATTWMNEEWYNDQIRSVKDREWRPNYETWLNQIVAAYQTTLDGKDKTFARFLLDLPSLPADVLDLLRELCLDISSSERMQVGFTTLRGLAIQRPSMRTEALNVLFELTTHPEKRTRGAAINTVKPWVPHQQPMDAMIREFALQMLRKLQLRAPEVHHVRQTDGDIIMNGHGNGNGSTSEGAEEEEAAMSKISSETRVENGEKEQDQQDHDMASDPQPQDDLVHTPYLPERIELPAQKQQVLQHVELLFALSVKVPDFLDEIFNAYGRMDQTVQEAMQDLITPLIRSLGSSHSKLLTLMRQCTVGSESLVLRILTIFTEHGRPSAQLVALVKALIIERNLDARFLIPVIGEMDKADIMKYLPRIVSSLNGQGEQKNLVRSVFSSVVTTPPLTFGSVSSNLPRVRQSELLTPAELMVLLHDSEKEIGLKSTIEAIGICFSMTDVFRSEILAAVMQQIVDQPTLPVLFMRTVIQAITTYKSLVGFVSTTVLSRLITKKIWTNPPLWEGFMRCAKIIAPASFGALLQLPREQLRELVDKQPSLKAGLRDYVTKKAPNKARGAGLLDIFGEPDDSSGKSGPGTPQPISENVAAELIKIPVQFTS